MAEELNKKDAEELRRLIKLLGEDINDVEFENLIKSGSAAKTLLSSLRKEAESFSVDIGYAANGFKNIVNEIRQTNNISSDVAKNFDKLSNIAEQIKFHQRGINELSLKDVESLKIKAKIEKERLQDSLDNLNQRKIELKNQLDELNIKFKAKTLDDQQKEERRKLGKEYEKVNSALKNINITISDQDKLYNGLVSSIDKINNKLEEENKLLGIGGTTIGGLSTALDKLGFGGLSKVLGIDEANDKMKSLAKQIVNDKEKESILQERVNANQNELLKLKDQELAKIKELEEAETRIANLKSSGAGAREIKAAEREKESIGGQLNLINNKKNSLNQILNTQESNLGVLKNSNAQYAGMGGQMSVLKSGISSMGASLKQNLTSPLGIAAFLITQLIDAIKLSDKATGDLAKEFNITYDQAANVRNELIDMAEASGDVAVTTRGLQESMVAIGKTLGSNARLNEKDLVFMTQMREKAGFTNDELVEMQKITFATGGNLEDNTKNLLFAAKVTGLNNKVLLNEKDIMRDVAKASNAVKLSVVGGAEALGKAAAQAKALGLNLNQLDNIAGGLLDFESSITAELEAQLLTGKNINLEQARLYAINNDMEGLAREIAKNAGSAEQFGKMNRIQQEAIAKAVGMQREELATMLIDQEALKGLSGKAAEDAKAALAGARARGMTEEEIKKKGIKDLMQQQSVQERLNQSVEKLKEIFVSIAEPILEIVSPLADLLTDILPPIVGLLQPTLGALRATAHAIAGIVKLITLDLSGAAAAFNKIPGDLTKGVTSSTQYKMARSITGNSSAPTELQDGLINPEGGLEVKGEKGTYKLDKDDYVVASPNLNNEPVVNQNNNISSTLTKDMSSLSSMMSKDVNSNMSLNSTTSNLVLSIEKLASKLDTLLTDVLLPMNQIMQPVINLLLLEPILSILKIVSNGLIGIIKFITGDFEGSLKAIKEIPKDLNKIIFDPNKTNKVQQEVAVKATKAVDTTNIKLTNQAEPKQIKNTTALEESKNDSFQQNTTLFSKLDSLIETINALVSKINTNNSISNTSQILNTTANNNLNKNINASQTLNTAASTYTTNETFNLFNFDKLISKLDSLIENINTQFINLTSKLDSFINKSITQINPNEKNINYLNNNLTDNLTKVQSNAIPVTNLNNTLLDQLSQIKNIPTPPLNNNVKLEPKTEIKTEAQNTEIPLNKETTVVPNNSDMVLELKEIKNILGKTLNVDIEISRNMSRKSSSASSMLNSDRFGTFINTNTYKIQ